MDLRELEAFLAVAEELHFGRAADRLHLTTTRVSQSVRALERRVGGPLFERTTRRVKLTPLGERLLADLRPAYLGMTAALHTARAIASTQSPRLRLAFATSMSPKICTELVEAFQRLHPGCQLVRSARPSWGLHTGELPKPSELDLFITWAPGDPDILQTPGWTVGPPLRKVPRALLVGTRHPLAGRSCVDIEELADHPLLYAGWTEAVSPRMNRYSDAWTPPSTPAGRPLQRVRRMHGSFLEELMVIIAEGDLAHLTMEGITDIHHHVDVTLVPLTGLPPMLAAPVWPSSSTNPMLPAFLEANTLAPDNRETNGPGKD